MEKRKLYSVSMPITGFIYVEVEAASEVEAKQKFYDGNHSLEDVEEWSTHESIADGNVIHCVLSSMEIDELKEL
ncbi:MAG: hypothetical protein QM504_01610 [Pseudomonadota bacterium]